MIGPLIKYSNALVAGYSFILSCLTRKTYAGRMPVAITFELTNFCNLKCPECNSGSGRMIRKRGYMDINLFEKIVNELNPYLLNLNLYFQGEPMLHPQFFSFISKSRNNRTVVSTNGHFLSEENAGKIVSSGLKELVVSLDGLDQNTYSSYRINGDIEKVFDGIRNVAEAKRRNNSKLKLIIQMLINRHNEHQVSGMKEYARKMNAFLKLKSMQITDKNSYEIWLPSKRRFRRYELQNNEYKIRSRLPNRCSRLWFNPVITWNGKVLPCCFDKDAHHVMGDLNEHSFREIWSGPEYRSFRRSLLSDRCMIEICNNCTSGLTCMIY